MALEKCIIYKSGLLKSWMLDVALYFLLKCPPTLQHCQHNMQIRFGEGATLAGYAVMYNFFK